MISILRMIAACAALLMTVPVWTGQAWCAQRPEVISSGVRSDQGAVAWSPDGKTIAYLKKRVELYDVSARAVREIRADNPFFVNWSYGGKLLILHGLEGHRALAVVDPATRKVTSFPLGVAAKGVYPLGTPDSVLVTTASAEKSRDGSTSLHYKLFRVNIDDGTLVKRFEMTRPLAASDAGLASMVGWMQGGLHPLEFSAVLFAYVRTPNQKPYMKLASVAQDSGSEYEIYRAYDGRMFVPSGSFSPAGRRLAFATAEGRLRVFSLGGALESPDNSLEGFHPAWSPGGDWIYFGGMLVSAKGKRARELLKRATRSVAAWRPDGSRLAVSSGGKLWIFDTSGLDSPAPSGAKLKEMRDKVKLLRELFSEEFVDEEEYIIRYSDLLNRYGL